MRKAALGQLSVTCIRLPALLIEQVAGRCCGDATGVHRRGAEGGPWTALTNRPTERGFSVAAAPPWPWRHLVGSREGSFALVVRTAVAPAAAGWFSLELPTWANTQGMKHEAGISTSPLTSSRMTAARGQARRNNSGPSRARVVNDGHDRVCANINNIGILAAPLPRHAP